MRCAAHFPFAARGGRIVADGRGPQAGERVPKNTTRPSKNPDVFLSYRVVETGEGGDGSVFALREALESVGYSVFVGEQALKVRDARRVPQ